MSRRFLLGTPKGQNTTADTYFNTLLETIYLVPTSAPTVANTTFSTTYPTTYLTYYNTNDIVPTSFSVITSFNTPYATTRPTSAPTDYPVITAYISTFGTMYSQNTNTSFTTNYTYPVPTEYITPYPLFTTTFYGTSRPTSVTEPVYQSTIYSNPTTYPGFTTPTAYPTSASTSYSQSFSGCFYYDSNGNIIAQDSAPAGCVNPAPCSYVENFTSGSVYTYFNTSSVTSGTTTFLTHVYVAQSTSSVFYTPGRTDPANGIFGCYDANDPDVFAYCQNVGTCEGCNIFNSTTFDTDVGYDTYTTAAASVITNFQTSALTSVSYLSSRCYPDCAHTCTTTTSYFTFIPTFYSPSTVVTSYPINTFIRNTTYSIITYFNTSNETFTGEYQPLNTLYVTQYPTSNVTSNLTTTSFIVNTTNPYNVPTTYLTSTSFITSFPTDYVTSASTEYIVPTSATWQTSNLTSNDTSNDTTRSTTRTTEWLTTYPQNTEVLTSRSTTWFTQ